MDEDAPQKPLARLYSLDAEQGVTTLLEGVSCTNHTTFDAYVNDRLVLLWTKFPGAQRVEILRETEAEDGSQLSPWA